MSKPISFIAFMLAVLSCAVPTEESRTPLMIIVVVPDNQFYSEAANGGTPAMNLAQVLYASSISANAIIYEGDNYNNTSNPTDQTNIPRWVSVLNKTGIPWISPPGNHDYDDFADGSGRMKDSRTLHTWNTNVGSQMATQSAMKGSYPSASYADSWLDIGTHGGTHWGVLALQYCPTDEDLNWADQVVNANPTYKFIVTTHDYLTSGATLDDMGNGPYGCAQEGLTSDYNDGQGIFDKLVANHDNQIRLVLNGHWNPTSGFSARRIDVGSHNYKVNELYFDPQSYGDNGFLRVLTFYTDKSVKVVTYSPVTSTFLRDSTNQFSMDLSGPNSL